MRKLAIRKTQEKVDPREWDFSLVPSGEERSCCFYEYARESTYIVKMLDEPEPAGLWDEERGPKRLLRNSPLFYALPQRLPDKKHFDAPWLAKEAKWRAWFCKHLSESWEGLSYLRAVEKTQDLAFHPGISMHFPWQQWTERHIRLFDDETGKELLLVTIDWRNFEDSEIIAQFAKWVKSKEGRPRGVGLRHTKGKRADIWRKKLERLAIMRLRHYYSLSEIFSLLPAKWQDLTKFVDEREVRRERKAARLTLLELFPFLPKDTLPINWPLA